MSSIRTDKQIFPFFDSVKHPVETTGNSESFHNSGYSSMTIEVTGVAAGKVQGCMNIMKTDGTTKLDSECVWTDLALIDLKDFSLLSSFNSTISEQFSVAVSGMSRVRVALTSTSGEVTVVGVAEA